VANRKSSLSAAISHDDRGDSGKESSEPAPLRRPLEKAVTTKFDPDCAAFNTAGFLGMK